MLLAGDRWGRLDLRDRCDVIEAVLAEDNAIDTVLNGIADRIARMYIDEDTWGESPAAEAGMAAAERRYEQAKPVSATERAKREARKAERERQRVADSGP